MSMCRFLIGASLALAAHHVSADPFSVGFYYDSACSANAFNMPVTTISGDGLTLCEPVNGTLANAQYYTQSMCSNELWKVEFYKDMNCTVKALASAGSSASNDCVDSGNFGAMHVFVRGQCAAAATTNTPTSTSTPSPSPSSSSSPTTIAPSSSSSSTEPSTTISTSTSTPTPTTQPTSSSASDTPTPTPTTTTTTPTPTPTQVESSSPSTSAEPSTTSAPTPTVTSTTEPLITLPITSSPSPTSSSSPTPTTTLKPTKEIKFSSATIASSVTLNTVWMLIGIGAAALAGIMTS